MNFQPYIFHPQGYGVYAPIRESPLREKRENLTPATAALYWKRQRKMPNVFSTAITSRYNSTEILPSAFAQYGRGRRKVRKSRGMLA